MAEKFAERLVTQITVPRLWGETGQPRWAQAFLSAPRHWGLWGGGGQSSEGHAQVSQDTSLAQQTRPSWNIEEGERGWEEGQPRLRHPLPLRASEKLSFPPSPHLLPTLLSPPWTSETSES